MLDGDTTNPNDLIYDLFLGTGQITSVSPDGGFDARFGSRVLRYAPNGLVSGVKRAYWRHPVLEVPRKNDAPKWALYRRLIAAVKES